MRHIYAFLSASVVMSVGLISNASGQVGGPFDLSWHSLDGGGITFATGGSFELGGTLGQYDAHEPMVGGAFEVTGGFWAGNTAGPCSIADFAPEFGVLDFDDVLAFLVAFGAMDPVADLAPGFGVFDFDDVLAFLTAFGAGCP